MPAPAKALRPVSIRTGSAKESSSPVSKSPHALYLQTLQEVRYNPVSRPHSAAQLVSQYRVQAPDSAGQKPDLGINGLDEKNHSKASKPAKLALVKRAEDQLKEEVCEIKQNFPGIYLTESL